MIAKQIFKFFSEKNAYLICPDTPTFHEHNDVQKTKVYQSLKEISTYTTFLGRKETSITAAGIIAKSFKFKHACEFMEEQFSLLVEDKSSYESQGKQKKWEK